MLTIGERIKELRIQLNLTQFELAKRCGLDQSNRYKNGAKGQCRISSYETGRKTPPVTIILKLAKALKITPGALLEGISKKSTKST